MSAPERRNAKIEEDDDYDRRGDESAVIGAMFPTGACLPNFGGEDEHRQQEEDAGNLKPERAADAAKGAQKAADPFGEAAADASGSLSDGGGLRLARGSAMPCGRRNRCGGAGEAPACRAARYANPDAQDTADGLRFHSVYDGNSDPLFRALRQLPIAAIRHRN